jgi:hypothetical protein
MYSRIWDKNFWDLDPGSRMKNLGIRVKTSRIHNTDFNKPKTVMHNGYSFRYSGQLKDETVPGLI